MILVGFFKLKDMKKIIYILALLAFTSCEKDQEIIQENCNCGQVTESKKLQNQLFGDWYYEFSIYNSCTGNDTTYYGSQTEYNNYLIGDTYCFPSKEW